MSSLERFQFILSFIMQALLLTGVAVALERRCANAVVKTRIWTCYYLSVIAVLLAGLTLPRMQWTNPWQRLAARELLSVIRLEQLLGELLLATWLVGTCIMLARWMINFHQLQRFMRSCKVIGSGHRTRLLARISKELTCPLGREVQIRVGPESLGPSCYQFHRPIIFLPPSLLSGDDSELRYVLQHELEHLRTQHPLQVFGQRLAEAVLWFLPAVYRAGRRAGLAREYVCDDAATSQGASTANYLRTLLRFAQTKPCCTAVMLGLTHSASDLRLRAQRLASPQSSNGGRLAALAPAALVAVAVAASQLWLPTHPLASTKTS